MSTPFQFFRRNQKVALAAVTGMAILSFLVQDTMSSGQISPTGIGILLIGSLAIVGWVWGAKEGKSGDNAMMGALIGLGLTLGVMFLGRPPAAMSATSGNLSADDLGQRILDQSIANRMISLVHFRADPIRSMMEQFRPGSAPAPVFDYGRGNARISAIISELLNREADELGIEITDEAIMTHLKEVAGKDKDGEDNLTRQLFDQAIQDTSNGFQGRAAEEEIFAALRHELRGRQAANLLLGGSRLTPVDIWDLHRKLNIRQTAQVVGIPVSDFVQKDAQPSDSDLLDLFNKHKDNIPNTTPPPQPKLEEGRPGFYLPRRMKIAYVEPNYEEIEKQVGEITEEEILKRYEEQYKKEMPSETGDGMNLDLPVLPSLPTKEPAAPTGETPAEPTPPAEGDKPAAPDAPPATEPAAPGAEKAAPEAPAEPAPPAEPKPEPAPPTEEKPAAEPAKPEGSSLRSLRNSKFQPVALIQEAPADKPADAPADKPADAPANKPADAPADKPADAPADKPEDAPADKPADAPADKPADAPADKPADAPLTVPPVDPPATDDDPAPPVSKVRPLDDELKARIRQELLDEKMQPLLSAKTDAARELMTELQLQVADYVAHEKALEEKRKSELPEGAISPEAATEALKKYAEKNGLTYTETDLMTLQELTQSDDYPITGAMIRDNPVSIWLERSPAQDKFSPSSAIRLGDNRANYAFWKVDDVAEHAPKSIDEPGVKEMVIKAWRDLQARPLAEKRAQALSEIVAKSDKPMAEALSDQTVTGEPQEKSLFVTVTTTGEFSWLQRNMLPSQFGMDDSPRLGAVNGVIGANNRFMTKVFDEMKAGETAVVPNQDLSVYYVVRIEKRTPSTDTELETMKNNFLGSGTGNLSRYANQFATAQDGNFVDRLFTKHGVKVNTGRAEDEIDN